VTVGINDLGFSSLVSNSILKASGGKRRDRINGASNKVDVVYPARLDALKDAIDRELNPRHVFITEYPIGIFKEIAEGAPPCGVLGSGVPSPGSITGFDLDGPDARDLTALGVRLNATIRAKAMQFGWVLVDGIESGFDKHGYCASDSYFVSATQSCLKQGDFEGMLHPNRRGHAVTRDCIASALRRELHAVHDRWLEPVLHVLLS
jgi:hypothetical protein